MAVRKLFGLAVDEYLSWGTAHVGDDDRDIIDFKPGGQKPIESDDIHNEIAHFLDGTGIDFDSFSGIGVSCIGVVYSSCLMHISRKNWKPIKKEGPIIDFLSIFQERAKGSNLSKRLAVQNDATAAAIAELTAIHSEKSHLFKLFYVTVNEGVNGAFVQGAHNLPAYEHSEMGHIRPALRADDPAFYGDGAFDREEHSGCSIHQRCFEGVASRARLRRSWGGPNAPRDFTLRDIPRDSIAWQLEAFYIAQLCMSGALMFAPDRIVIAGPIMDKDLLPLIREKFKTLDNGYFHKSYMSKRDRIQQGRFKWPGVNLRGALQLARLKAVSHSSQHRPLPGKKGS